MVQLNHVLRMSLLARAAWTSLLALLILLGISLRCAAPGRAQTLLPATTTWIGNTLSRSSNSNPYTYVQEGIDSIYVAPNGALYAHSGWDEGNKCVGIYQDGHTIGSFTCGMEAPGGITGDGSYVYFAAPNPTGAANDFGVIRGIMGGGGNCGYISVDTTCGGITGLAVSGNELFVTDQDSDQLKVYTKDFSSQTPVTSWRATQPFALAGTVSVSNGNASVTGTGTSFTTALAVGDPILIDGQYNVVASITSNTQLTAGNAYTVTASGVAIDVCPPTGAMVADTGGNIWMVQKAIDGYPAQIICTDENGNNQNKTITDVVDPRGMAINSAGQLMVCECGPAQNIRIYNISGSGTPTLASTFGNTGGIFGQGTAIAGTVSVTSGSPTVTGNGTSFQTVLAVGDTIYIDGQVNTITSIANNTQTLTVNNNYQCNASGVACDLYSSSTMGQAGPLQLTNPVGVGVDSAGNIYVGMCNLDDSILQAYTSSGTLLWEMDGDAAMSVCSPDPASETDIYGEAEHFSMNYSEPSGNQWTYAGCTYNPFKYPMDWRLETSLAPHPWECVRICGQPFLVVGQMYDGCLELYRFNAATDGQVAIPCVMLASAWTSNWPATEPSWASQSASWIWVDSNGNGQMEPSEFTQTNPPAGYGGFCRWRIDQQGNIWQTGVFTSASNSYMNIRKWNCPTSLTTNGVPAYSLANSALYNVPLCTNSYFPGGSCESPCDNGQDGIEDLNYDANTDTMYLTGFTPANPNPGNGGRQVGTVIASYTSWSTNPTQAWSINLPYTSSDWPIASTLAYDANGNAGAYLFVGYEISHIVRVYQTSNGAYVGELMPGYQCESDGVYIDYVHGLTAYLRGNGEYVICVEQGYYTDQETIIRWTPNLSAPSAPTGFSSSGYTTTTASLSWTAVSGATGYSLERQEQSTTAPIGWGTWSVLDGSIPAASTSYTDSELTPGVRYAYRLRALNASGDSDYSNTVLFDRIDLPFTDDFTSGVLTTPWTITDGYWAEANGILSQTSTVADSTARFALVGNAGTTYPSDYMIEAEVQITASTGGISNVGLGTHLNSGGGGYGLYFNGAPSSANLELVATYYGGSYISFPFTVGTWYWFKLLVQDGTVYGKVWQDGTQEPANWLLSQTETYYPSGLPGLMAGNAVQGTGYSTASFQNVSVQTPCVQPTFMPAPGMYSAGQLVTISSNTGGATIRYTTDGSTPSETAGTVYSSPVSITSTTMLQAIAYENGMPDSLVTSGLYSLQVPGSYFIDTTTSGTWWSSGGGYIYGSDGYVLCAWNNGTDVVSLTGSYVQSVTPSGQYDYFYNTTTNSIAPINPQTGTRAESCWMNRSTQSYSALVTLANPNDGIIHRMAVYCWDWNGGRTQTIDMQNPSTGLSELPGGPVSLSNYTNGTWVVFYFTGNVKLNIVNTNVNLNALTQVIAFDNQCEVPAFSPAAGTYAAAQTVTISTATSGAAIRYTTDGSTPSVTAGTVYSSPVSITSAVTLQAIAYENGYDTSPVTSGIYTFNPNCDTPAFNPTGGTYANLAVVTISSSTNGASIYYTTNGTTPSSTNGSLYSTPVNITSTCTLQAIAYATGFTPSGVTTGVYTIPQLSASYYLDTTTSGNWWSVSGGYVYGSDGYVLCAWNNGTDVVNLTGSYVQSVTPSGQTDYYYNTTTNTCAPINPSTGTRDEACWLAATTFDYTVALANPEDGITHRMAVYCWDWNSGRTQTVNLLNPVTGQSELPGGAVSLSSFTSGTWVVFNFQGNVEVQVTDTNSNWNALVQMIAFDNQCAAPSFTPAAGSFSSAQAVTISTTSRDATIYYTANGTTPSSTNGTLYSTPVNIVSTCTLEAIAYASGCNPSNVTSGVYTIPSVPASYYLDTTTSGNWWSSNGGYVYGSDGYVLCAWNNGTDVVNLTGSYVQSVTPSGQTDYYYNTTTNTCAPINPSTGTRDEACWLAATAFDYTVALANPEDGITHRMAVYCWDWNSGRTQTLNLLNPVTGQSELPGGAVSLSSFTSGTWVVFNFQGNVEVQVTNTNSNWNALVQMIAFDNQCAAPSFTPAPGNYSSPQSVTIGTATSGATIYYTANGTTPSSTNGTVYSSPVSITVTGTTLQAIAYETGYSTSSVASGIYTIQCVAPTFSPAAGTFTTSTPVTISTTTGSATINYTTNGTTPSSTVGTVYSNPVSLTATSTLQAIAYETGYSNSTVSSGVYTIQCAAPTFTPVAGTFTTSTALTISTTTSGASIRYTTNGTTPSSTVGTVYSSPVSLTATSTLQAIAYETGLSNSSVTAGVYTIQCAAPTFNPAAGSYTSATVTISTTTSGASIRYTTNGTTPSSTVGTVYSSTMAISQTGTLQAIAYKTGLINSTVTSGAYTVYLGTTTAGGTNTAVTANEIRGTRFQAGSAMTLNHIALDIGTSVSGNIQCAIYSDSSSKPGTLLKGTNALSNPGTGWQTFTLTSSQALTSGTYYWLLFWSAANYSVQNTTSSGSSWYRSLTYGTWPSSAGSGTTETRTWSIYGY